MTIPAKRLIRIFLFLFSAAATVKILFAGYDIDEQYAVSMSYRLLQGDRLLWDMWEPHQTSGFLCALLMAPYLAVTGSSFGVILYLRCLGLIIHITICLLLHRQLCRRMDRDYTFLVCVLFFFSLPKLMFLPEFSNMQIWFLTLTLLCLLPCCDPFWENSTGHVLRLILGGIFLSLEILSYPSALLVFPGLLIFILCYGRPHRAKRDAALFGVVCLLCGGLFLCMLLSYLHPEELLSLLSVVASDGSHSATAAEKLQSNLGSLAEICGFFVLYFVAAALFATLLQKIPGLRKYTSCVSPSFIRCFLLFFFTLLGQLLIWLFAERYPNYPSAEYFFLAGILLYLRAKNRKRPDPFFFLMVLVPLTAFVGIVLFTNHPLMVSAPFLGLAGAGGLSWLGTDRGKNAFPRDAASPTALKTKKCLLYPLLTLGAVVMLFGRCYLLRTTGGQHYTLFQQISLIRGGCAAGIFADSETVRRYNACLLLVNENLPEDARVFYAGISSDIYLMKNMEFCTPSTISSPTFDDKIADYFAMHPEKEPEYVICDRNLSSLDSGSWLADYLSSICNPIPIAENDYLVIYSVPE